MKTRPHSLLQIAALVLPLLVSGAVQAQIIDSNANGTFDDGALEGYFETNPATTTGTNLTAVGEYALKSDTSGLANTAFGCQALYADLDGSFNTGVGAFALVTNTKGASNSAVGYDALTNNLGGNLNTAEGDSALRENSNGSYNTGAGAMSLYANVSGSSNTAIGAGALSKCTSGSNNIAIGYNAGTTVTTGSNNITIGGVGFTGDTGAIRIGNEGVQTKLVMAGIWGATASGGLPVYVNGNGQLGTVKSSARFKTNIKPMGNVSDALLALHPVTFQYKHDVDPSDAPQFGLIAEQVEKVDPDLVVHDNDHQIYSVRYDAVNAMLLNEFQKQHETITQQEKTIAEQQKLLQAMEARLDQVEKAVQKK